MVRERDVEKYLVQEMEKLGLACIKFVPEQLPGMPDRMVLLEDGRVMWVELKTKGGRLSAIQKYRHEWLRKQGHGVWIVWDRGQVDAMVREMVYSRERIEEIAKE